MKKNRKSSLSLSRALERASNPAYLVSMDREILDMNQACLDWLELDIETARGGRCFFTSETLEQAADDRIAGVCPPPELFSAADPESSTATANIFRKTTDGPRWRSAQMTRLADAEDQPLGILVIAAAVETLEPAPAEPAHGIDPQTLHAAVAAVRSAQQTRYSLGNLLGVSPFAERLRRQVTVMAQLPADLLITGPVGSGREHLARTIAQLADDEHDAERLRVVLHCVLADEVLTRETIDSLPSHSDSVHSSLLMLLDIDKLTGAGLEAVRDLLKDDAARLRVISTSERSLLELAAENLFPADLAHRLTTVEIPLVPLANRPEDIPLLAQAFVEHENASRSQQLSGFEPAAMQLLKEFHWPGNLEQLQLVVSDACRETTANKIVLANLPDHFRHAIKALRIGEFVKSKINLPEWLEQLELELIQRAVAEAKGNKAKAASLLGITRSKFLRRLKHFDLSASPNSATEKTGSTDADDQASSEMIDPSAFEELD